MIPLTQKITSLGEAMIGKTNIDQFKKIQLESVFQKFTESDIDSEIRGSYREDLKQPAF